MQQLLLQQQGKTIVEFKAGKLKISGTTVTSDPRRGTLMLMESAADGMTRLQWKTRPGGSLEDDLVIIPNDATVEKIPECKTGRVLLVRMRSASRRLFFWMQEPDASKDDEIIDKMKTAFAASRGQNNMMGGLAALRGAGEGGGDMEQAIQQFLMQQQGGAPGGNAGSAASANQMAVQQMRQMQTYSLTNIMSQSKLILDALDEKASANLFQFLPEGQQDAKGLEACINSPQLQQGASRLTRVLNSAQYGNLVTSFGLMNTGTMGSKAFIDAIQAKFGEKEEEKSEEKEESKEESKQEEDKKMETN